VGEVVVLIKGFGEGGEGGGDVADVGWGWGVFGAEGGKVGAEGFALAQSCVVGDVLDDVRLSSWRGLMVRSLPLWNGVQRVQVEGIVWFVAGAG
jgi:hypothetical protein